MAAPRVSFKTDSDSDDDFVSIGSAVLQIDEDEPLKKPTTVQDLTARDKQGRRRFHGAFTGGFSAGYFNTVGTKEGFTPSTFVSSRSEKHGLSHSQTAPEDFMDEEDLEEHGFAPRKFVTTKAFTSEERKRKRNEDLISGQAGGIFNLGASMLSLISPDQLPIGMKILRKMGWREGQGIGPRRVRKKKKKTSGGAVKTYGCALPPSDDSDSDSYVPESMSEVTFAPQDVSPMPLEVKSNVHGLGYRGIDPGLALPGSNINLFSSTAVTSGSAKKGIRGQAFGVGAFEDDDEDIYAVDNMSNYDITMQDPDTVDTNFGWTAPKQHGKQSVPVHYVGKLLEGFCLSSKPLPQKKKYPRPELPRHFRPVHWSRKRRGGDQQSGQESESGGQGRSQLTAVERGLLLGETPIMDSVFDLVSKQDKARISATQEAISMTKDLSQPGGESERAAKTSDQSHMQAEASNNIQPAANILSLSSKFKPMETSDVSGPGSSGDSREPTASVGQKTMSFPGSVSIQPFRKDPAKQRRYDQYLALIKLGQTDPHASVSVPGMTEWENARERDEFSKAAKLFRPLSAMMSSRFVSKGTMIDEHIEAASSDQKAEKSDEQQASEMKMFGKLTHTEVEWHPDKLLCKKFNVPNPYPGSDVVGVPSVKRDKYSVFDFLSIGDFQAKEEPSGPPGSRQQNEEPPSDEPTTMKKSAKGKQKKSLASLFDVLDDPNFHKPGIFSKEGATKIDDLPKQSKSEEQATKSSTEQKDQEEKSDREEEMATPTQDLFRAIFKNSDSEDSDDSAISEERDKGAGSSGDEDARGTSGLVFESSGDVGSNDQRLGFSHTKETPGLSLAHGENEPERSKFISPQRENSSTTVQEDPETDSSFGPMPLSADPTPLSADPMPLSADLTRESQADSTLVQYVANEGPVQSETLSEDEEDSSAYGPSLPPPQAGAVTNAGKATVDGEAVSRDQIWLPSNDQDKGKVKNRNREHKHKKKEKKEKKKKSKHKKEKKSKRRHSSKKSRERRATKSSDSEADSESSREGDSDLSDSELLNRLRQASQSGVSWKTLAKR